MKGCGTGCAPGACRCYAPSGLTDKQRSDPYVIGLRDGEVAALRHENKLLRLELYRAQERHTLILPSARDARALVWQVPIRVGHPFAKAVPAVGEEPWERPRCYRLEFELCEEGRGLFWRSRPFATEPENIR
jgi:hypothetical protein